MEGIEFDEDKDFQNLKLSTNSTQEKKSSFMLGLLEKAGVTDKSTASLILLAITVIVFGVSFYLYAQLYGKKMVPPPSPSEIRAQMMLLESMSTHR